MRSFLLKATIIVGFFSGWVLIGLAVFAFWDFVIKKIWEKIEDV